jgi:multidrug resistance efflux pump
MTEEDKQQSDESAEKPQDQATEPSDENSTDPVRKWTLILLAACAVLMLYYVVADRITPYTTQARVHALVVPIAAEVSGTVIDVPIGRNEAVDAGDLLFQVEPDRYQMAVETAEANLQAARQATGASTANIDAAEAQVRTAEANLVRAERDAVRLRRIKEEEPGAVSDRRVDIAEASYVAAKASLQAANANLERARQELGETGEANYRILQARADLEQAELNLERTAVLAPDRGIVTDVRVNRGNFAQAGVPLMTFLAFHDIWIQADFTENNLGHIKAGDEVDIVFDALPGKVVKGTIRMTGFGVNVESAPLGSLPTIENDRQWLRDAQRFSVVVDFELPNEEDRQGIRVGAQASVMVYTGGGFLFNSLAWIKMRILSLVTYVF